MNVKEYMDNLGLNNYIKPLGRTDKYILGEVSSYYTLNNQQTHPDLVKMQHEFTEDSNPIICLMSLKK